MRGHAEWCGKWKCTHARVVTCPASLCLSVGAFNPFTFKVIINIMILLPSSWAFLVAQRLKCLPAMRETQVRSLGRKGDSSPFVITPNCLQPQGLWPLGSGFKDLQVVSSCVLWALWSRWQQEAGAEAPGWNKRTEANLRSPVSLGNGQTPTGEGDVAGAQRTPWPHCFHGLLLPSLPQEGHLFAHRLFLMS